jgi:hypothetical protein
VLLVFNNVSEAVRQSVAKSTLNGLMAWLGDAGLSASVQVPGLLAEVDQHAAAVRDALGDPQPSPDAISLAGYASGVRDASSDAGWLMPDLETVDWSTVDWSTLRLVAVCALARSYGYV